MPESKMSSKGSTSRSSPPKAGGGGRSRIRKGNSLNNRQPRKGWGRLKDPRGIIHIGMVERQRLRAEKELQKNSSRAKNLIVEGGMDPSLLQHDLRFQGDSSMYTMDMQFKRTELAQHPLIRQEIEGLWEMMSVELEGERLKKMRAKHMAQFSTSSSSAATHQDTWRSTALAVPAKKKLETRVTFDDGFERVVRKQDYIVMSMKLQKCIMPHFKPEAAKQTAIDDWVHDTTATPFLSQNKLSTIFAAALSPSEMTYAQFHRSIFELVDVWVDTVDVEAYTVLLLRIQKLMTKPLKKISFDPTFLANLEATTPLHCELEDQAATDEAPQSFCVAHVHEQLTFSETKTKSKSKSKSKLAAIWDAVPAVVGEHISSTKQTWCVGSIPKQFSHHRGIRRPLWLIRGPGNHIGKGITFSVSLAPCVVYICFFGTSVPEWLFRHSNQWQHLPSTDGISIARRSPTGKLLHNQGLKTCRVFQRKFHTEHLISIFGTAAADTSAAQSHANLAQKMERTSRRADGDSDMFVILAAPLLQKTSDETSSASVSPTNRPLESKEVSLTKDDEAASLHRQLEEKNGLGGESKVTKLPSQADSSVSNSGRDMLRLGGLPPERRAKGSVLMTSFSVATSSPKRSLPQVKPVHVVPSADAQRFLIDTVPFDDQIAWVDKQHRPVHSRATDTAPKRRAKRGHGRSISWGGGSPSNVNSGGVQLQHQGHSFDHSVLDDRPKEIDSGPTLRKLKVRAGSPRSRDIVSRIQHNSALRVRHKGMKPYSLRTHAASDGGFAPSPKLESWSPRKEARGALDGGTGGTAALQSKKMQNMMRDFLRDADEQLVDF